jgi:hypothetical protein
MKKILTTIALAGLAVISSHAQGLVIFSSSTQNTSTNNTAASLGAIASGKISGANNYYFALFYSASPITLGAFSGADTGGTNYAFDASSGLTLVTQSYAASTASTGRFAAISGNSDSSVGVPTIPSGGTAYFTVLGWSANLGTSISALQTSLAGGASGFLGQSVASGGLTLGNAALGGSQPDTALFGTSSPFIQGFTLGSVAPVPEPATIALAGLSGASLLLFRRRK